MDNTNQPDEYPMSDGYRPEPNRMDPNLAQPDPMGSAPMQSPASANEPMTQGDATSMPRVAPVSTTPPAEPSGFNTDQYKEQLSDAADSIAASASSAWQTLKKVAVAALGVVVVGLIAAATIPNWWAHRLGDVIDEKYSTGLPLGLILGFICTLVPLMLLAWGFGRRSGGTNFLWFAIPALVVALPNLATLWVTIGVGNGAESGRNTLDVEGPGVRGGTLTGAVLGLAAFVGWQYLLWTRRKARAEAEQLRADASQASYQTPPR